MLRMMGTQKRRWLRVLGWMVTVVAGGLALWLAVAVVIYPFEYVRRVVVWGESDVGDYLEHFPQRDLTASPQAFHFTSAPDDAHVSGIFESILGVMDFEAFLESAGTQAFIVIRDDVILYEHYFNDWHRELMVTSYSVAKSFTSALVGIAIEEGYISGVDDPITNYLPELTERDVRFRDVTIRHLLMMASGMDYADDRPFLFNGDGPLTTYHPDQRKIALETGIVDPPGEYFLYNKYHPQLLGMILERATGVSVTQYTQDKLWDPLGMEFDGAWSLDSEESGFEKMEAGLNARAIDFAKFGRLFLENGNWDGHQVIPARWVAESTGPDPETHRADYYSHSFGPDVYDIGNGWYKYMWYGADRDNGPYDFSAQGDRGQVIYVSPANNVIIVRNAFDYGLTWSEWLDAFQEAAGQL